MTKIKQEINSGNHSDDTIKCLNKIGLVALDQFDYSIPEWAKEYYILFRK